jgi:hypothetical protein
MLLLSLFTMALPGPQQVSTSPTISFVRSHPASRTIEVQRKRPESPWKLWKNGPSKRADYFPIAVWLQDPRRAQAYQAIGINLYIGLWKGPTSAQLATLAKAKMPVICTQNSVGLKDKNNKQIVGWMQVDEPDNARVIKGGGYGPPIPPADILASYRSIQKKDKTRPVFLNFGQGIANKQFKGRGTRTGKLEDYPAYSKGADLLSFDIYPITSRYAHVSGRLEYLATGMDRLVKAGNYKKPTFTWIECTQIQNPNTKPTPSQVRSLVWIALISGAKGIGYFCHEWKPRFHEDAMLRDKVMNSAIGKINKRVASLAKVLNTPPKKNGAQLKASHKKTTLRWTLRRLGSKIYLFAVNLSPQASTVSISINGSRGTKAANVLDENRKLAFRFGRASDRFGPYEVHLYEIQYP